MEGYRKWKSTYGLWHSEKGKTMQIMKGPEAGGKENGWAAGHKATEAVSYSTGATVDSITHVKIQRMDSTNCGSQRKRWTVGGNLPAYAGASTGMSVMYSGGNSRGCSVPWRLEATWQMPVPSAPLLGNWKMMKYKGDTYRRQWDVLIKGGSAPLYFTTHARHARGTPGWRLLFCFLLERLFNENFFIKVCKNKGLLHLKTKQKRIIFLFKGRELWSYGFMITWRDFICTKWKTLT